MHVWRIFTHKSHMFCDHIVLAKFEGNMEDLCVRRATAVANSIRFKAMTMIPFESFQKDPDLDAVKLYDEKMKA